MSAQGSRLSLKEYTLIRQSLSSKHTGGRGWPSDGL